ncbi:hypothetical protein DXT63_01515 [Thermoanaerobacteraceae bacterium SP2]|nr:hypothetical protein DXT63_01515 [Thermoanaerobacteraceae bacterium SP2]
MAISSNIREIKLILVCGILSATTFVSKIRNSCNFKSPKKLAAFCGIDFAIIQLDNLPHALIDL